LVQKHKFLDDYAITIDIIRFLIVGKTNFEPSSINLSLRLKFTCILYFKENALDLELTIRYAIFIAIRLRVNNKQK